MIDKHLEHLENHWNSEIKKIAHNERNKILEEIELLRFELSFWLKDDEDVAFLKDLYLKAANAQSFEEFIAGVKTFRHQYQIALKTKSSNTFNSRAGVFKYTLAKTLFDKLLAGYEHNDEIKLGPEESNSSENLYYNEELTCPGRVFKANIKN